MTVAAQSNSVSYNGNGVASAFTIPFRFMQDEDLVVKKVLLSDDSETALALNTDYTLTGEGSSSGGTLTLVAGALSSLYKVTILRATPFAQSVDFRSQGALYPETIETGLDTLALQNQDIDARVVEVADTLVSDRADLEALIDDEASARAAGDAAEAASRAAADASESATRAANDTSNYDALLAIIAQARADFTVGGFSDGLTVLALGSTLARAFNARFGEVQNALDFGMVADGTTDDTAALQAAIDRAYTNGGGVVLLPPRKCRITAQVNLKAKVKLQGWGKGVTIIELDTATINTIAVSISSQTGVSLCDLTVQLKASLTTAGVELVKASGSATGDIYSVDLSNGTLYGLHLDASTNWFVDNLSVNNIIGTSVGTGVFVDNGSTRAVISNLRIIGTGQHGLHIRSTGQAQVTNFAVVDFGASVAGSGLLLEETSSVTVNGFVITDGTNHTTRETRGITIDRHSITSLTPHQNRISNGTISSVGGSAIAFLSAFGNYVSNVSVVGNSYYASATKKSAVLFGASATTPQDCTDNEVTGLTVSSASGDYSYGVIFDAADIQVQRNHVRQASFGAPATGLLSRTNSGAGAAPPVSGADRNHISIADPGPQNPTFGATIDIDLAKGKIILLDVTPSTAFAISNPTNAQHGDIITMNLRMTSAGSPGAITWGSKFVFSGSSYNAPGAGASRGISFVYDANTDKIYELYQAETSVI